MKWLAALAAICSAAPAAAFDDEATRAANGGKPGRVLAAEFAGPVARYGHEVLGETPEWSQLKVLVGVISDGAIDVTQRTLTLPAPLIFEDIAPRLVDFDGDRSYEIVVVQAGPEGGARLAVYGMTSGGLDIIALGDPIGRRNRWLAPAGIADFDGDGRTDIAYVETPHLRGLFKIVTLDCDAASCALTPVVVPLAGFSNHRIGEAFITAAVRACEGQSSVILPDLRWTRVMEMRVVDGALVASPVVGDPTPDGVQRAARC